MMMLTGWSVEASFTCISMSADSIKMVLGASEDGTGNSIIPKMELQDTDYENLYWIGDRVDGGFVVVKLINALSDEGLSITTAPKSMGEVAVHLTCHASIEEDMEAVPVEIYSVGTPKFWIQDHIYLYADGVGNDVFEVDTSTGNLNVTENGIWHYEVDEETGTMEVMYK